MIKAGNAPVGPLIVPNTTLVNGINKRIKMMNGIALNKFTINETIKKKFLQLSNDS